ncbi:hypothetical protein [Crassaminicella indica]|uniref:Uncharacterized protein n=1 Tax=Crassaminicella indica TaxID=2855394 RepID=A0ABX8RDH7_9CLOT|nr:hypothetical protein [Crassaminicella indica]QXM07133.1 hypothetical protein KVH43_05360 [Crassaminicella indica]
MNEKYKILLIRIIFVLLFFVTMLFGHLSMNFEFHSIQERACTILRWSSIGMGGFLFFVNPDIVMKSFKHKRNDKKEENIHIIYCEIFGLIISIVGFEYAAEILFCMIFK